VDSKQGGGEQDGVLQQEAENGGTKIDSQNVGKSSHERMGALRNKPRRPGQVYHHKNCDKKAPSNTRLVPEKKRRAKRRWPCMHDGCCTFEQLAGHDEKRTSPAPACRECRHGYVEVHFDDAVAGAVEAQLPDGLRGVHVFAQLLERAAHVLHLPLVRQQHARRRALPLRQPLLQTLQIQT
jgi:hypothetical protein